MPFESEIGSGEPAQTLIQIAERTRCEAIFLGALRRSLLGSVSPAVLHSARVPATVGQAR
jgi:nucleotide-binding universal stress UspA family protein